MEVHPENFSFSSLDKCLILTTDCLNILPMTQYVTNGFRFCLYLFLNINLFFSFIIVHCPSVSNVHFRRKPP
jgi:hypothetical protein